MSAPLYPNITRVADELARGQPLTPGQGEGQKLRLLLEEALGIPKNARSFSVTFAVGQTVVVHVEYIPHVKD